MNDFLYDVWYWLTQFAVTAWGLIQLTWWAWLILGIALIVTGMRKVFAK
jgi:hypothetical protein